MVAGTLAHQNLAGGHMERCTHGVAQRGITNLQLNDI
jgi:hypothetical protein